MVGIMPSVKTESDHLAGVVTLSPACKRALVIVVDNLRLSGYEVVDL